MKNYLKSGDTLTLTAPAGGVLSGQPYLFGTMLVMATTSAAVGEQFEGRTVGAYEVTKAASQAWTIGARVYWDNSARNFTTTVGSNTLVGVAIAAVGAGASEVIGRIRLNGSF